MKFKKLTALSCTLIALMMSQHTWAHTSMVLEFTCPIGGETFKQRVDASGMTYGMRTNMRPIGRLIAPPSLTICPSNGFVMFKQTFTPEELAKFERVVQSQQYQDIVQHSSSYFAWGRMMELADEHHDSYQMMWIFLKASWQRNNDELRQKILMYADKALVENTFRNVKDKLSVQILRGEMLRQLQRFDEAQAWFEQLQQQADVQNYPYLAKVIAFQLSLIAKKDHMVWHLPSND